jgi:hypothetical protein
VRVQQGAGHAREARGEAHGLAQPLARGGQQLVVLHVREVGHGDGEGARLPAGAARAPHGQPVRAAERDQLRLVVGEVDGVQDQVVPGGGQFLPCLISCLALDERR